MPSSLTVIVSAGVVVVVAVFVVIVATLLCELWWRRGAEHVCANRRW